MTAPTPPRPRRFRVTVSARDLRYGDLMLSGPLCGYMVSGIPVPLADSVLVPLPGLMTPRQLEADCKVNISRFPLKRDEQLAQLTAARDACDATRDAIDARIAALTAVPA